MGSERVVARAFVVCGFVYVPERATTRRFAVFCAIPDVPRARTLRVISPDVVPTRAVVAARAPDVRGTTRRSVVDGIFMVLTTVFIGFNDCDVVTPGFRFVRI